MVARLTLDDSRFIQGTQRSEQQSRQATQRISNSFQDITRAAQRAGQAAQAVELNDRLDQEARRVADQIRELERNAQRADQSVDDIVMNTNLLSDARRAADEIEQIRAGARQAAGAVDDIDLGNRLRDQLRDAQGELDDLYRRAGEGGGDAGARGGSNFLSSFAGAIGDLGSKTGPIGASILGVAALGLTAGAMLAGAIKDGMQAELGRDMFQAQTGVTVGQARKFAQAAGEAYADTFGESVAGNLDTARLALQNSLLDPGATQRDAEEIIKSLDGVARILGEDVPQVARAAGNAVKSGFAADVNDAFDLMVKGAHIGLNASEDLMDTIIEYSVQFEKVGLTGAQAFGLMNQAVQAGARDTDTAADAIKEFAIRAIDGSTAAAEAYQALGFDAAEMSARVGQGGEEGAAAMEELLTKIRETEDPLVRNAVAVGLFGTKAEDLGNAMNELDLTTAVQSMNDYEGAAKSAIEVMTGNAATSVEGAMRSIERAGDGLKAALAEAFGPYISEFADTISNNRAGVIGFFIDVGNAAFDGAEAVLRFVANGMRGLAEFAQAGSEMSVQFLRGVADMVDGLAFLSDIPFLGDLIPDLGDAGDKINALADAAESGGTAVADGLNKGAEFIEGTLIPAVGTAQERFGEFAGNMQLSAAFNDEIQKVNDTISEFGVNMDGSVAKIENWTGKLDQANPAQKTMHDTLSGLSAQFLEQNRTGLLAGATVEELTRQYAANRDELIRQAREMGLTNQEALKLIDSYGLVPNLVDTQINQPGMPEAQYALDVLKGKVLDVPNDKTIHTEALTKDAIDNLSALGLKVETLPDGTVLVTANTDDGQNAINSFINSNNGRSLSMYVELQQRRVGYWQSQGYSAGEAARIQGPVPVAADGAIRDPQIRDGHGRGIIWAEDETVKESYIPWALSKRARSERILAATAEHFGLGLVKMADGGITGGGFNSQAAVAKAMAHDGEGYVYGGLDCSGYLSAVFNAGTGQNVRFTTDSDFAAMGWQPGYDPDGFNIGTNGGVGVNGHMAGTLYGTNIESDGTNGIQYGGGADGAMDFPEVWHWPGATSGDDPSTERTGTFTKQDLANDLGDPNLITGTTDSGATLATDGQRVFVTNWPSTLGGTTTAAGTTPQPTTVSISGGSGGGTPQTAGLPIPPTPGEQLSTRFGEFGTQAGEIGTQAALDAFGLGGTLLDPNHRYWKAIRDTQSAFAGMNEQDRPGGTSPSMRRNGVQIANNITVSNDQEQIRKLLETTKRLLMQYGGAGA
ncbi:phage tail tape measure protein [Rhodococcus sp. Chr-9]|uniref:phage tail tape measure protein n=1 Tax=Rhodococcus sp. Chr-9 TaxID=713612 RepID=UPI00068CBBF2|nr:phage tail tape measure protein [Rhodococcus sp. Chr-9]